MEEDSYPPLDKSGVAASNVLFLFCCGAAVYVLIRSGWNDALVFAAACAFGRFVGGEALLGLIYLLPRTFLTLFWLRRRLMVLARSVAPLGPYMVFTLALNAVSILVPQSRNVNFPMILYGFGLGTVSSALPIAICKAGWKRLDVYFRFRIAVGLWKDQRDGYVCNRDGSVSKISQGPEGGEGAREDVPHARSGFASDRGPLA
ncbi:MAG: hypothetical protein JSS72_06520 [Armatimonadetes bacterium]|nr:hypothetical protein [Armatimonadota bacterium]